MRGKEKKEDAKDILAQLDWDRLLSEEQVVFLEAKMMLAYWERNFVEAEAIAAEALVLDNKVIFAHRVLAESAFIHKKLPVAVEHYSRMLEVCPNHEATIANLAITLFRLKNFKKAFECVANIKANHRRLFYKGLLWLMRPAGKLFAMFCLLYLFLISDINKHIYLYMGFMIAIIAIWVTGFLTKNNLVIIGSFALGIFVTGVWALSILLRSVF